MIIHHSENFILAAILMILSLNVAAINCNQESPNLAREGDAYFDIKEAGPLTGQQKLNISNLFSSFKGERLNGSGVIIECIGSEKTANKIMTREEITAEIKQQSNSEVVIHLESFNKKKQASHGETIRYFDNNNSYHIIESSANHLVMISKLRIQKVLNEVITDISIENNSLIINVTRYTNGYFAVQVIRTLK